MRWRLACFLLFLILLFPVMFLVAAPAEAADRVFKSLARDGVVSFSDVASPGSSMVAIEDPRANDG